MKKVIIFALTAIMFISSVSVAVIADNSVEDIFGNEYVLYDINGDESFDIRDLVRLKRYIAGESVFINLNFINDRNIPNATDLALLRKELLK